MKKNRLFFMFAALFVAAAVMFSCQKEEMVAGELMLKGGDTNLKWDDPVCVEEEVEFCLNFTQEYNKKGEPVTTNVQIQVYDPEYVNPDTGVIGGWVNIGSGNYHTQLCVDYEFPEVGEYQVRYKIGSGGFSDPLTVEVVNCGCDYVMTGEVECDGYLRTATFVYTPAEDGWLVIQGGLTNGATNVVWAPTGYQNLNSNASVGGWEGPVTACTAYTFVVTWEYEKYNGKDERIMEDGNVIGDWTAKLYTDNTKATYLSGLKVDEMVCGDELDGYVIFPVPVE